MRGLPAAVLTLLACGAASCSAENGGAPDSGAQDAGADTLAPSPGCSVGAVRSGLLAYYAFDEGQGAHIKDCSGNANHGAVVSPSRTSWIPGHAGHALLLGGDDTCVDLGTPGMVDTASSFSAAAWVFVSPSALSSTKKGRVVGRSRDVSSEGWELAFRPDGKIVFSLSRSGKAPLVVDAAVPVGKWTHVAGVFRPGDEAVLWVDGVAVSSAPATFSSIIRDAAAHLRIGCKRETLIDELAGAVDEVRVYDRALAAYEIAELAR